MHAEQKLYMLTYPTSSSLFPFDNSPSRVMVMETPSPQCVGREFVRQYYTLMNEAPNYLHRYLSAIMIIYYKTLSKYNVPVSLRTLLRQITPAVEVSVGPRLRIHMAFDVSQRLYPQVESSVYI